MRAPVAKPAIKWLDLSPGELRRARNLIRDWQGEGVLDELGFGIIQSAIADRLYPATNTIMTRSRYLYFLPTIYRRLEAERVPSTAVEDRARQLQDQLREALAQNESEGVIGRAAKVEIRRLPSDIYWSALRKLGMFRRPLSEAAYEARFEEWWAPPTVVKDDDDRLHVADEAGASWDERLPSEPLFGRDSHVVPGTNFRLSRAEARDLRERFRTLDAASGGEQSLLSHLVEIGQLDVPYPWAAPRLPEPLRVLVRHAEAFSLLARGVTLQYHQLLLEARARAGLLVPDDLDVGEAFRCWWEIGAGLCRRWDLAEFLGLPTIREALRLGDQGFLARWVSRLRAAPGPKALLDDEAALTLVRERERLKRPFKARLKSRTHLEQWNPPDGYPEGAASGYELSYRHAIGRQFVSDIVTGLGGRAS